jgi:hypothetical protein
MLFTRSGWVVHVIGSGAEGLYGDAFQRENFGIITQESAAIRKDFLGNSIKVSDLSLSNSAKRIFQSVNKLGSLFSSKSVLAAEKF